MSNRYNDIYFKNEIPQILEDVAANFAFKDLFLQSYDSKSFLIGFGSESDKLDRIIPSVFKNMSLFTVGSLKCEKEIDLQLLETFIEEYLHLEVKTYDNPFINTYEGFTFKDKRLDGFKQADREKFGKINNDRGFVSVNTNKDGDTFVFCHSYTHLLFDKCIKFYSEKAKKFIDEQKQVRLDVLSSNSTDMELRNTVKQELRYYTVSEGLEFLSPQDAQDFIYDLGKILQINYNSTLSLLVLINDTFRPNEDRPVMKCQVFDKYIYNCLHINTTLLLPNESTIVFNPSTFQFFEIKNKGIEEEYISLTPTTVSDKVSTTDRELWVSYDVNNKFYDCSNYNQGVYEILKNTSMGVVDTYSPKFIYTT